MNFIDWRLPLLAAGLSGMLSLDLQAAETKRLDTLTVTVVAEDPALPLSITEVKTEDLVAPSDQSLQDFLDPVPGLFTQNQNNAAQGLRPSIRGFGSRAAFGVRGIRVEVDGVPMTLPDGQTELDAIDLGLLESVEVIRGPSSTLFGNAAGGAILLNTRSAPDTPQGRLDVQGGSHGSQRIRLEGGGQVGNTGLLGAYTDADYDGFRDHASTETQLLNARLSQTLGNGQLHAFISALDITSLDPGGLTAAQVKQNRKGARSANVQFNAGESIEQQRVALTWNGNIGDWSLQYTGYGGQRDFANRLPFTDGGQVQFKRGFGGVGTTLSRQFDGPLFRHEFSTGIDTQLQQDDRERYDNNDGSRGARTLEQDETALSAGIFVRDSIALNQNWETSIGIRYDTLKLEVNDRVTGDGDDSGKRDIDDISADISLSRWLENSMIYVRLASSFESPTFTELANPNGGGFNDQLESSDALNKEIGIKGQWQNLKYTAALYQIDVDDELLPFELATQPGRTFYRNAGQTQREGLELSADVYLNPQWSLNSSFTYSDNRFDSGNLSGNDLPGIPDMHAWLSLAYTGNHYRVAAIGQHIGDLYADDANTEKAPAYQLLHLQASLDVGELLDSLGLTLEFGIDNLLDKDYNDNVRINAFGGRYYEPAAGRTYRLSTSLAF